MKRAIRKCDLEGNIGSCRERKVKSWGLKDECAKKKKNEGSKLFIGKEKSKKERENNKLK